MVLIQMSI